MLLLALPDLDELVRDETVGLTVYALGRFFARTSTRHVTVPSASLNQ
jgi:hypothetical protein